MLVVIERKDRLSPHGAPQWDWWLLSGHQLALLFMGGGTVFPMHFFHPIFFIRKNTFGSSPGEKHHGHFHIPLLKPLEVMCTYYDYRVDYKVF